MKKMVLQMRGYVCLAVEGIFREGEPLTQPQIEALIAVERIAALADRISEWILQTEIDEGTTP